MSRPDWSSSTTRAASGFLPPGRGGSVGTSSFQRIQPAARQVHDQVQPADADVEELAVPRDVVDQQPLERAQRRVEGLERAERRDVHRRDRVAVEPAPEVEGQGFHLGQLGHPRSLGAVRRPDPVTGLRSRRMMDR